MSPFALTLLALTAFVAGAVDAVAGGGGLLTLPALLAAGLPPQLALATNKGQSIFGTAAATLRYAKGGLITPRRAWVGGVTGGLGALVGTFLVLKVRPEALRPLVIALLLLACGALLWPRPSVPDSPRPRRSRRAEVTTVAGVALLFGTYDGFFGPGTGTFLIVAFTLLLGDGLAAASASAKPVNLASNAGALALFAWHGRVVWPVALTMAAAQLCGGTLGAHLALTRGDRLVRRAVLAVSLALVAKLVRDAYLAG